jgi:hypothetical protein
LRFASDARLAFGLLALSALALAAFGFVGFGPLPSRALRSPVAAPPPATPQAGTEFVDVTERIGLGDFRHVVSEGVRSIKDAVAPGLGLLDLDDDGDLDLVLLGGPGATTGVSIWLNRHAERRELAFEDVTEEAGIEWTGAAQGVCAGDVDRDGDVDLFVTAIGGNLLLMNRLADSEGESLAFTDETQSAGVQGGRWHWRLTDPMNPPQTEAGDPPADLVQAAPARAGEVPEFSTAATFGDLDADGDLDLYVANYVCYFEERHRRLLLAESGRPDRAEPVQYQPVTFEPQPDRLYLNELDEDGDLVFGEVTKKARAKDPGGRGLGARFMLVDSDIYPDLYVANDASDNVFLHNVPMTWEDGGDLSRGFEDEGVLFGLSERKSGMGIARGDCDGDGDLDILTTNYRLQKASLFLLHRERVEVDGAARWETLFDERGQACGLGESSRPFVGWGCVFFDYDNDGDEDLFIGNGFTSPREGSLSCTPERPLLFQNDGTGRYVDVTSSGGSALSRPYAARGVVAGDLDRDGDLDLVIAQNAGPVVVLENRLDPSNGNRSLSIAVTQSPRRGDAVNVQVTVQAGRHPIVRELLSGSSYLSQGPFEAHFGLGRAAQADQVRLTWPALTPPPLVRENVPAGRRRATLDRLEPR